MKFSQSVLSGAGCPDGTANRVRATVDSPLRTTLAGSVARLTLSCPLGKHQLNEATCRLITRQVAAWSKNPNIETILIEHAELSSCFSVGRDIEVLAGSRRAIDGAAERYLEVMYAMVFALRQCPKPIITFIGGVVRGGSLALALAGTFQVATNRTSVSLSETGFGYTPDLGVAKHLSKLEGQTGVWLALTGARLVGSEVAQAGLASHFCDSSRIENLKQDILENGPSALERYHPPRLNLIQARQNEVASLFEGNCSKTIRYRLERGSDWAKAQATKMVAKAPLSTKIALRHIRTSEFLESTVSVLQLDYRITSRLVRSRDFLEGVRSVYRDMDYRPKWRPNCLESVSHDYVSEFFAPLATGELELQRHIA